MTSVVFIAGRDPRCNPECSHGVYMRTHARAALHAGYAVHTICLAPQQDRDETDFGIVHAAPTARTTIRQNRMPWISGLLAQKTVAVVRSLGRDPVILHAVGVWGHAAARADALLGDGFRHAFVLGAYTTHVDETASQWRGLARGAGLHSYARLGFELLWSRALVARYEAIAHRRARRVLVNYRSVQRLVEHRFGVAAEIVPYSVEQEYLARPQPPARTQPRAAGTVRIVCVARHDPRKGIDALLHALHRLKRAGVAFSAKLLGGGALLDAHRTLARALGLEDRVEILGIVPSVEPYLGEADIFVLPAREEQSGSLALLEAMRAGIACVASACDGIPEDVRHLEDAWLTAPGDVQSLTHALGALIADPGLRHALAEGACKRFAERFSAAAMTAALDRVYCDVLAEAGASGLADRGRRSRPGLAAARADSSALR